MVPRLRRWATETLVPPECEGPSPRVEGQTSVKALLIGIRGTSTASQDYPELKAPHQDVQKMRNLLINRYDYLSTDITILIDDGVPAHVQPTRANILNAIDDLVQDAKPGDRFCFHYSGHSTQIKSRCNSEEEDGLDECIIPSDGLDNIIVDNELNASLVMPLPSGSQLVAILDTCHSGSLLGTATTSLYPTILSPLDLKHSRCNRRYTPWVWPGYRASDEKRGRVVRSNARLMSTLPGRKKPLPPTNPAARLLARRSQISMNLTCNPSPLRSASGASDHDAKPMNQPASSGSGPRRTFTYRARTVSFTADAEVSAPPATGEGGEVHSALPGRFWVFPEEDQRCASPVAVFSCRGFCRDPETAAVEAETETDAFTGGVKADVISLSSCRDYQLTYEDEQGQTMTAMLVESLTKKPEQSLTDVLLFISHATYAQTLKRHATAKEYETKCQELKARKLYYEEMNMKHHRRAMSLVSSDLVAPSASGLKRPPTFPYLASNKSFKKKLVLLKKLGLKRVLIELAHGKAGSARCDTHELQNPELSSARPLDMARPWRM